MATAGKLTLTTFLTLDGVMQAPGAPNEDQSGDFLHGGWLVPYLDVASHWPRVTDPNDVVAAALNRQPKYVASRTLDKVEWHNSTLIREDVARQVAELKRRYPREIQVHGSGDLAQTLLEHDLVDEFHLWLYPVVLGSGKRLFGRGTMPAALTLTETRTTSSGGVVNSYRRTGKPAYGSFGLET